MTTEINQKALEQVAFNVCSLHGFAHDFVARNEKFATAVIVEYLTAIQERGEFGAKSLRDEFAMAALTGLVSKTPTLLAMNDSKLSQYGEVARGAYEYADAMLEARK